MIELQCKQDKEAANKSRDFILALVEPWISTLCTDSDTKVTKLRENLAQRVETERGEVDQYTPLKERIQHIHAFSPYQPSISGPISVQLAIKRMLEMPLTLAELDSKYLYIYWCPGDFRYVKIGVADDVPQRLRGWEEGCKQEVQEHLQQGRGERIIVKHAFRVEKLVHTELKEVRFKKMGCKGCGREHNEWFNTRPEHAAKVVKKYSDWTATNPYQFHRARNSWKLDEHIEERKVEELSEPIDFQPLKSSVELPKRKGPLRLSTQKAKPRRYNKFG
ncbi:hypothetical protein K505DRAFT_321639 [Melanomma pulvis-pyrius CBS 109.77]|uniref:Bacteriophage T5 Orf172 DNA-binding domain-containing protein n=1 Tax=Melanomma pulvis-pyrius CBS 109.77 TaxID=1314802 RepID=A0A6A6XT34_9PLEO|nr:hypothetical protein K505DRAFT_321639 [Melanomma pulvis-pyrius CBS 109.77]